MLLHGHFSGLHFAGCLNFMACPWPPRFAVPRVTPRLPPGCQAGHRARLRLRLHQGSCLDSGVWPPKNAKGRAQWTRDMAPGDRRIDLLGRTSYLQCEPSPYGPCWIGARTIPMQSQSWPCCAGSGSLSQVNKGPSSCRNLITRPFNRTRDHKPL